MYRPILVVLAIVTPTLASAQSTLLAGWDFQTTSNGGTAVASGAGTPSILKANFGTQVGDAAIYLNGSYGSSVWIPGSANPGQFTSANGSTANLASGFSNVISGGAAALSLRNTSANGQSLTIALSLTGYSNLVLSYASRRSETGFNSNQWAWSTDGATFENWGPAIDSRENAFSTVTLATLAEVNNASSVYLRYTVNGASAAGGSNQIDNIQISATAIPEPSTYAALFGGAALLCALVRRRRSRSPRFSEAS